MKTSSSGRKGFSLFDSLIWLAVLALVMAVGLSMFAPKYLRSGSKLSGDNACIENMIAIETATEAAAEEFGLTPGDTVSPRRVDTYISGGTPACPKGGTYAYPPVGGRANCSVHGSVLIPQ